MTTTSATPKGIHKTIATLRSTLRRYIEAQYHIWNESLIRERRLLLEKTETLWQDAFLEATPVYEPGSEYKNLNIPDHVSSALQEMASRGFLPETPYSHQSDALEQFLSEGKDLVIATGTGSGKTESFLMPIMGQLISEGVERPESAKRPGVRALLLYPMNALVNDQLGRIRTLFGTQSANELLSTGRNRPVTFGSYTGRTPYPGARERGRDQRYVEPLFESFYLEVAKDPDLLRKLKELGRWPSKDLEGFFGKHLEEEKTYQSGKRAGQTYIARHWPERLRTQPGDRELLTRHEMQEQAPDILITNYSMLEYMLMRPLESPLFEQTADWLSDPDNEFVLVLDEAHMYRGAGGAEVALLIRRLMARLGIARDRMRVILTSASLGSTESAIESGKQFAVDLTGAPSEGKGRIAVIQGKNESRSVTRQAASDDVSHLAAFDINAFQRSAIDIGNAVATVNDLGNAIGFPDCEASNDEELRDYLYEALDGYEPIETLIRAVTGKAVPLGNLENQLFGEDHEARSTATAALIALATAARRKLDRRVLLPARAHLFFRGIPGLFACINRNCNSRSDSATTDNILGRLHAQARVACECPEQGRVYELLTHRDCGSAFLQAYLSDVNGDFLWHEPSSQLREDTVTKLIRVEVLVERDPSPEYLGDCESIWIDVQTGRLTRSSPENSIDYLHAFIPDEAEFDAQSRELAFNRCPICGGRWRRDSRSKIMDHATKGEAPFANLVKTQLLEQPASKPESHDHPNGGRKVLLFSDGRQKAARLARDIPREVEQDVFRQALVLAAEKLSEIGRAIQPAKDLYVAFLAVVSEYELPFFDRGDAEQLKRHVREYRTALEDCDGALLEVFDDLRNISEPHRYTKALLQQLCGKYYSLRGSTVGFVEPTKRSARAFNRRLSEVSLDLANTAQHDIATTCIGILLSGFSFDPDIDHTVRRAAASYRNDRWGHRGTFTRRIQDVIKNTYGLTDVEIELLSSTFMTAFCSKDSDGFYFLRPTAIQVRFDLDHIWYQCGHCMELSPVALNEHCSSCGQSQVLEIDPRNSEYIRARKGFWRDPIAAALAGTESPKSISVEEHSAQLSNRDYARVYATTELYELRFQDVPVFSGERPIDVLSCTTTMEVGVDIGSLVAVGLRNVPPERQNYQQRAGRAGRRGASLSTVITYAQNGPHDAHYFHHPSEIVAGDPRTPELKVDNPKIARRHVNSYLIQTFFREALAQSPRAHDPATALLQKCLGPTVGFFSVQDGQAFDLGQFSKWVDNNFSSPTCAECIKVADWLPDNLQTNDLPLTEWVVAVAREFCAELERLTPLVLSQAALLNDIDDDDGPDDAADENWRAEKTELLEFLFYHGFLPTYAFPTDLTSFLVEEFRPSRHGGASLEIHAKERPQQSIEKALSEYAPGRLIVINKETFRSGGIVADVPPTEVDRAERLFANAAPVIHCSACSYVMDPKNIEDQHSSCPVCSGDLTQDVMLKPEVFLPENGRALAEDDRAQEFTYATMAQFPIPAGDTLTERLSEIGANCAFAYSPDQRLITLNKGVAQDNHFAGFWICDKCGNAQVEPPAQASHNRPYKIQFKRGQPRPAASCNGDFRHAYLGHIFRTDLLVVRIAISSPIATDTSDRVILRALEDAMYSIAEALRLAASRHRQLDLDPSEFGSGFRIVPGGDSDTRFLDLYLYDTLSGGAGYAEIASEYLDEILLDALQTLESCPGDCERSCQECLRHYFNQHIQHRLDRRLGAELLKFALRGELPDLTDTSAQSASLFGLRRLLELDGFECSSGATREGVAVPLLVRRGDTEVAVALISGLLDRNKVEHPIFELHDALGDIYPVTLNNYLVQRNLPDAHQDIRRVF